MSLQRPDARPIRVLAVGRDVGTCFGGAEKIAFELVRRLDPARFKRYLCIAHARPPERRELNERELAQLEQEGVQVLRLECRSLVSNIAWARLYSLLRRESIDILHAHMPRASVPGTILARLARTPVIVSHEHGWSFRGKPMRRFLDRNVVARGSDVLLAVSEWDRRQIVAVERIPAERIRILPNGIPSPPESGHDVRGELGGPAGTALVGAVGRLYPEKGYDDLIRAIALLKQECTPIRCVIAGHGPEQERLQTMIDHLGVPDEVRLIGRRQDIPDVIRSLDVAILSSKHEGSPLAVMEYMAGGAPIVATAVGGVPELIEDGVHGLLVRPDDPAALAGAIRRLLEDRALAARLGQAARVRQRASFDLEAVVRQLEGLYLELYDGSRTDSSLRPSPAGPETAAEASKSGIVRRTIEDHV